MTTDEELDQLTDSVLENVVSEHLTDEHGIPKREAFLNAEQLEIARRMAERHEDSKVMRAVKRAGTIGFQAASQALKKRLIAVIAVMAVIAGPVWFFAGQYHGITIDFQAQKIEELQSDLEGLETKYETLEEENDDLKEECR